MHPRANLERQGREGRRGFLGGRTQEIQRLVGRALRSCVRLEKLGERTITIDCDVLDADGGTRTASISGGFVALMLALDGLLKQKLIEPGAVREALAAVSVGLVDGEALLDLCYAEDSRAQVDLNLVATASGSVVEVQGTAEGEPMTRDELGKLIDLGLKGTAGLFEKQQAALREAGVAVGKLIKTKA
jgi:ribonuclease PH